MMVSTAPIIAQHAEPMIKINSVFDIEVPQNISVPLVPEIIPSAISDETFSDPLFHLKEFMGG